MRAEQRFEERFEQRFKQEGKLQTPRNPQQVTNKQLFEIIDEANQKASKLPLNVIVLVGKTRAGKSTFHNVVINPDVLVAREDGANTIFVLKEAYSMNPQVAKIDNTIKSVTIMPNITRINQNTDLIDFPGFEDRRNQIEVIQVQYIITKFLHSVRNVKFVVIFTQSSFKDIANDEFRETLQNFLSLFDVEKFSFQEKMNFYKSISFCITSVDFRRKPYQKVKERFLEQLKVMLDKLIAYNKSNLQAMSNFEIIQELIKNIIKDGRISLFQLAEEGEQPPQSKALQAMDRCGWRYFNLASCQQKILSRFESQFKKFPQQGQDKINELVRWRFSLGLKVRLAFGQMLNESINSKTKSVDIGKYLQEMNEIIAQMPTYNQSLTLEILPYPSADQKLKIFQQLYHLNGQIKEFKFWQEQNPFSSSLQYYSNHLVSIFRQQVYLINRLLGQDKKANAVFQKVLLNLNKMLNQSAIFSKLSMGFDSDFKWKFKDELIIAKELPNLKLIKQKHIEYFLKNEIIQNDYKQDEIKRIIASIGTLKKQFTQTISPNSFYKISSKLKQALVRIYKSKPNSQPKQILQQCFYILIEAAKIRLNINAAKVQSQAQYIKFISQLQAQTLNDISRVISIYTNNQPLIQYHKGLQSVFGKMELGKEKTQYRQLIHSTLYSIAEFARQFNIDFTREAQMPLSIRINTQQIKQQEISAIINEHLTFHKNQILQEKYRVQIPPLPTIHSEIEFSKEIIQMVTGKKGIIVLGQQGSGKTIIINCLKGQKIQNIQGKYDLQGGKRSRINHSGREDPFIYVSPISEDQFFIQIPSIFNKVEPSHRFIRICLMLNLLKALSQSSVILVQREQQFQSPIFISHIHTISTLFYPHDNPKQGDKKNKNKPANINFSLMINSDKEISSIVARNILNKHIQNKQGEKVKLLLQIIYKKALYYGEDIRNHQKSTNDYFSKLKYSTKKPQENYQKIYNQIYQSSVRVQFTERLSQKNDFLRRCFSSMVKLASNCWYQFQLQKQYPGTGQYKKLNQIITSSKLVKQYCLDRVQVTKFEPIKNNRTLIYANAMKIKSKGVDISNNFQFEKTYQFLIDYLQTYFTRIVFICCKNQQQFTVFMKLKHMFQALLKEFSFYCQLFKYNNKNDFDQEIKRLDNQFRLRYLTDQIDNFTDYSQYNLLKQLTKQKLKKFPNEKQLQDYIGLVTKYSKQTDQKFVFVKLQLIILMGTIGEKYSWSKDIDRRKLIEETVNILSNKKLATTKLIDCLKLIEGTQRPRTGLNLTKPIIPQTSTNVPIPQVMVTQLIKIREQLLNS